MCSTFPFHGNGLRRPRSSGVQILTLVQLDYKSNFEENVENTMIQKIITAEKEKYLKPFSSLLLSKFSLRENGFAALVRRVFY